MRFIFKIFSFIISFSASLSPTRLIFGNLTVREPSREAVLPSSGEGWRVTRDHEMGSPSWEV